MRRLSRSLIGFCLLAAMPGLAVGQEPRTERADQERERPFWQQMAQNLENMSIRQLEAAGFPVEASIRLEELYSRERIAAEDRGAREKVLRADRIIIVDSRGREAIVLEAIEGEGGKIVIFDADGGRRVMAFADTRGATVAVAAKPDSTGLVSLVVLNAPTDGDIAPPELSILDVTQDIIPSRIVSVGDRIRQLDERIEQLELLVAALIRAE